MTEKLERYYRTTASFEDYTVRNKKRVESISKLYEKYKKYFGKRVLDLCCGAGILGFIVEKEGKEYVGVDLNKDMIEEARKYAEKIKSKCKFYLEDVKKFKIDEKFDTVTCIGNSLAHLTVFDWIEIMKNVNEMTHKDSYFIIEYRDVVNLLFEKQWKEIMVYESNNKTWIDITKDIDVLNGKINKVAFSLDFKDSIIFDHAIWSSFILRAIMKTFRWEILEYEEVKEWDGWVEVYKRL